MKEAQRTARGDQLQSARHPMKSYRAGVPAVLLAIIAALLCLSLSACGGSEQNESSSESESSSPAATTDDKTSTESEAAQPSGSSEYSWQEFLTDYEDWVDSYVVFMKKYKENPTDASLVSEASAMAEEALEWSGQVEQWDIESMSASEAAEYTETLNRINEKLSSLL